MIPPVEFLGKTITIYPIMALIGVFVSGIFACKQAAKLGLDDNDMICVLLFCAVGALLGVEEGEAAQELTERELKALAAIAEKTRAGLYPSDLWGVAE